LAWSAAWLPWNLYAGKTVSVITNVVACIVNVWLVRKITARIRDVNTLPDWVHLPSPDDVYQHAVANG